jgi:6-phospho-beta-glucosidase
MDEGKIMKLTLIGGGGVRAVLFTKSLTLKAEEACSS